MSARPVESIADTRLRLESAVEKYWSVVEKIFKLLEDCPGDQPRTDSREMEAES